MVVVRSSSSGCCISSREVCLPKGGSLLLDGHGAHFTDICFSGTSYSCTTASLCMATFSALGMSLPELQFWNTSRLLAKLEQSRM